MVEEFDKTEKLSNSTCDIVPDFDLYIKKRVDLHQGWYSCDEIHKFAIELFTLGIEFAHHWNNCYINPPENNTRVIVNINVDTFPGNRYYVCDYCDKKFTDVTNKKNIYVYNDSKWIYLNYPSFIK